jgi:hypothetical protein
MTEADWDRNTQPQEMLEALRASGRASERKLRLFACACCRRIWPLLTDGRSRQAVEVAERFADGRADADELAAANESARQAALEIQGPNPDVSKDPPPLLRPALAAWAASARPRLVDRAGIFAAKAVPDRAGEEAAQAALLRCIIGPVLFRPLPQVAPAVLGWNGGTVARLAAGIYEERDFTQARMGVLADAAEEAGLADADLLAHLRSPGPHVRGCWVLDVLLGRE